MNGCNSNYNLDSSTEIIVFSKRLNFNKEIKTHTLDLGVLSNQTVKSVDFTITDNETFKKLGFMVNNLKYTISPGNKDVLEIKWSPEELITRKEAADVKDKLKHWIAVDRSQETSFSITAKVETNCYIWNVYVSAVL